jgi:cathepsin L
LIATFLATTALSASAVVDTVDYDRLALLPALTGNPGDQDWRAHGAVLPVKNEGDCDASWAFAVAGLVESNDFIRTGTLKNLSTQELLDCTGSGSGCSGGSPISALRTVIAKGGLASAAAYPYTARQSSCRATPAMATIPGAGRVPPGDEVSLQNYVARGPVLALVNDQDPAFDSYHGGIFSGPCGSDAPTRAVLIVGYTTDYWIVKNSRGTTWGVQGYIYMSRDHNTCGIANFAIAVSNDPLPAPIVLPVPALSASAVAFLALALAGLGLIKLRRPQGQ